MNGCEPEELTKERNLFAIYRQLRKFPKSRFNLLSTGSVFIALVLYAMFTSESVSLIADKVRSLADLGLNFAAAILGFLIAGFTIFFTVSKLDLFISMSKIRHNATGVSWLKYSFFVFVDVFTVYLMFIAMCIFIKIFASPNGPIYLLLTMFDWNFKMASRILSRLGIVIIGTWFFYLVVALKSFIFNVYHIAVTAIRWEIEKETLREQDIK